MRGDYEDVKCNSCRNWFEAPDYEGDEDDFVCDGCAKDRDRAVREDMSVARRKYGRG